MKKLTLFLLILTLLASACSAAPAASTPPPPVSSAEAIAEGRLAPVESLALHFSARGKVAEILVAEGERVAAGAVLARLVDSVQAEAGLAAARLELISAQQDYDALMRTAGMARASALQAYINAQSARAAAEQALEALDGEGFDARLDDARLVVNDAKDLLEDAQEEFDKYKDLDEDNDLRKTAVTELEEAQEAYNQVVRDLEMLENELVTQRAAVDAAVGEQAEAKRAYENTAGGPDADQLARLEARLANAQAQAVAAEQALEGYLITAPFAGVVAEVHIKPGELLGPEKPAFVLADFSRWMVETTDLTEMDVVKVFVGQSVRMAVDALPEEEISGTVESISQTYSTQAGDVIYTVTIAVDDIPPAARWGMTVEATFEP